MRAQINLLDELIIDSFAGGGGTATGIEWALGRPVDIAINHDKTAIGMHEMNHPYTKHYCEDVFDVDPAEATQGRPVGLFWLSPDCTHFSKAKGGKPVKKEIRGLAWLALKWASAVKPRLIILENVEEFQTWGPIDKTGQPIKDRKGETFRQFVEHLRNLGYVVEWRVSKACDYGAPTSRKRLSLIARCDGLPIVWPKPTHGEGAGLKPYRTAAECIDFTLPCPSIFTRKKPLATATMRRIARGLDKFTIKSDKPFIIQCNHSSDGFRGQDIEKPMHTLTGKHGIGVVAPHLTKFQQLSKGQPCDAPVDTVMAGATRFGEVEAALKPYVMCNNNNNVGSGINEPLHTATTGNRHYLMTPHITQIGQNGFAGDKRSHDIKKPLSTMCTKNEYCYIAPNLIQYHAEQADGEVRAQGLSDPVMTIDTQPRYGLSTAYISKYFGGDQTHGSDINEPLSTVTAIDHNSLVSPYLVNYYSTGKALDIEKPLPTATAKDRMALTESHLCVLRNNMDCKAMDEPMPTIATSPGHFAEIKTYLHKIDAGIDLKFWPQVRELLNKYCDYSIADDEVLILEISGVKYFISDIGMRMLAPRELFNAQGFPPDYIIDRTKDGKPISKAEQVKKVGNSVSPPWAEAIIRANMAEQAAPVYFKTMAEYNRAIAI